MMARFFMAKIKIAQEWFEKGQKDLQDAELSNL